VRAIWGEEGGPAIGPKVTLSAPTRQILARVRELRALRQELQGWRFEDDPESLEMLVLPADEEVVDLRNLAVSVAERERLDRDRKVALLNRSVEGPSEAERDQVRFTNDYRVMMGRGRLAWNPKLQEAARKHSDWMNRAGQLSHFEDDPARRTPGDRMRLEGYLRPAGENCSVGQTDPLRAHEGWCHSSGHHRNLLWEGHTEMASAVTGRFWTQNFGGGAEYRGNLIGE